MDSIADTAYSRDHEYGGGSITALKYSKENKNYDWKSMEKAGVPVEQFRLFYRDYKEEAYESSQDLIRRCCEYGTHYIHLDIDAGKEAFEYTLSFINTPGHIVAFREEAPQDSGKFLLLS